MGPVRRGWNWIKFAWERQPVLFVSTVLGFVGPVFVALSPGTKKTYEEIENWPTRYKITPSESSSKDTNQALFVCDLASETMDACRLLAAECVGDSATDCKRSRKQRGTSGPKTKSPNIRRSKVSKRPTLAAQSTADALPACDQVEGVGHLLVQQLSKVKPKRWQRIKSIRLFRNFVFLLCFSTLNPTISTPNVRPDQQQDTVTVN